MESPIEETSCKLAEDAGWIVRKLKWIGRRSAMDRFFLKEGRIVLIEFKNPGKTVKGGQSKEYELFKAAGAEVHVCDNVFQVLRILGIENPWGGA